MTTFKPVLVELTAYITCYYIFVVCLFHTIRYDTIEEINVDSKAEYTA